MPDKLRICVLLLCLCILKGLPHENKSSNQIPYSPFGILYIDKRVEQKESKLFFGGNSNKAPRKKSIIKGNKKRECLNVGTVPTYKVHNKGDSPYV